jgi:hypothetical protein
VSVLVFSGYRDIRGIKGNRSNMDSWPNKVVHAQEGVAAVGRPDLLRLDRTQPGQV